MKSYAMINVRENKRVIQERNFITEIPDGSPRKSRYIIITI